MKCQQCQKQATLHITEVTGAEQFEELHLCEECAQEYLTEPQPGPKINLKGGLGIEAEELTALNKRECPLCGVKFGDFRTSGRLGCPNDYEEFRKELAPLLENIHGDTKHCGKVPRRQPTAGKQIGELARLRKQLQQAISKEDYEGAARIRDQIRQKEGE